MSVIRDALKHGHDISVCRDCAKAAGGIWPAGHLATQSVGLCRECERERPTCSLSDWSWPGRIGRKLAMRREI
jgi:hypothetical protein